MKTTIRLLLITALLFSLRSNSKAGALDNWSNKNPGGGATLNEVAYSGSIFVAVGDTGVILTSTDTTNWVMQTSGSPENLYGVTYANGTFIAVGDSGALLSSLDGTNWFILGSITGNPLNRVTYGSSKFVAVGNGGTVLTSPDGANWTQQATPTTNSLAGIIFANGEFIAVGSSGTILTSANGTSWSTQNSGTNAYLAGVSYGAGTFVAVGNAGTILTSPNATSWSPRTSGTTDYLLDITFNNGKFVIVGGSYYYDYPYGPNLTDILTSSNGTTWTAQSSPMPNILDGVSFGGGAFVAVGIQDTIMISTNGSNWACRAFSDDPLGVNYNSGPSECTYGNGVFVLGGYYTPFFTSPDGVNWSARWPSAFVGADSSFPSHIVYAHGLFIAVEPIGIFTSTDGVTWSNPYSYSSGFLTSAGIAYGNGQFVVAGQSGQGTAPPIIFLTSPNGTNWTARTINGYSYVLGWIAFGNNTFIVPTDFGTNVFGSTSYTPGFLTSTNGVSWTTNLVSAVGYLNELGSQNRLTFGNGIFLLVNNSGNVFTSPNGLNWEMVSSPPGQNNGFGGNVAFGNDEFILTTADGIATSVDGVSWLDHDLIGNGLGPEQEKSSYPNLWLNSLIYGEGIFVGVNGTAYGGTVVTSGALNNPELGSGKVLANNTFQMTVTGKPSRNYAIEATTNFTSWSGLTNLITSSNVTTVVDPAATNFRARFYRAIEQ